MVSNLRRELCCYLANKTESQCMPHLLMQKNLGSSRINERIVATKIQSLPPWIMPNPPKNSIKIGLKLFELSCTHRYRLKI